MKKNLYGVILVAAALLLGWSLIDTGAEGADFASLKLKITDHVEAEGYSNQYIRENAKSIIAEAITDADDKRELSRRRSVIKSSLIKWAKDRKEHADSRAFLLHVRKAGTDDEIVALMHRLVSDTRWKGDPNAFLAD